MANKESSLIQLILSLTLITVVAGVALASVFSVTKAPIEASKMEKKQNAIDSVLKHYDKSVGHIDILRYLGEGDTDSLTVYMAYQKDELYGAAVETYTDKAFAGKFSLMVGFDAKGNILGTDVLSHGETPGLGDKINKKKDPKFSGQFVNFDPSQKTLKVTKDGGDVVAITAATISSRAFCDAIERAYKAYIALKPQTTFPDSTTVNQEMEASNE